MKANEEMLNSIILSIKPIYNSLIVKEEKLYEFRNFKPKSFTNYFWVYESSPSKQLKYLMKIDNPVEYPNQIEGESYGVDRFNSGEMKNKFAYKILELYELEKPLSMNYLIDTFNFTPPQAYTYLNRNFDLQYYLLNNAELIKII